MRSPLTMKNQNYINRVQQQAAIIQKKDTMEALVKQISFKTNVACLKIEECKAKGILDLSKLALRNIKRITICKCPNISDIELSDKNYKDVQQIDLLENQLKNVPNFLIKFRNVKKINLSFNKICHLNSLPFTQL